MFQHVLPLLLATTVLAQTPPLYFDGPEVVKLDWNTATPRAGDFNGDGLVDLAIVNSSRARIEFLLQRKDGVKPGEPEKTARTDRWNPILEVSRFEKQPLVIGRAVLTLAVGDWNGDKRPDIAFITDDDKLCLRMQGDKGTWTQKKEFTLDSIADDTETLVALDINGDGRDDIALLTDTRLMVILQKAAGEWAEPQNYALGESGCAGLSITDLDGDGRADIFYTSSDGDALLVRLQQEGATFGEEWRLEIPVTRHWLHPVRLGGKKTGVAWIQEDTGMVEIAKLTQGIADPNADRAATIRYAMPPSESKNGAVAHGDLTGDGHPDVVMSEPKAARLWLFQGSANGTFSEGREFPILSGVESLAIADVDADGKADLVLLSPSEQAIGVARWKADRLSYPEIVYQAKEGETLRSLTTGSITTPAETVILCVTEIKGQPQLVTVRKAAADKQFSSSSQALTLKTLITHGIRVVDANQDGRGDLALFSNVGALQLLLSTGDPKTPFKRVEGIPDSFVSKITPAALTTGDLDGDGKDELLIANQQLARAFKVDANGKASIVEQFNAPESTAELHSALVSRKNGKISILLIDAIHSKLHELTADKDRVYRADHTRALPVMTPDRCLLMTAEKDKAVKLLLLGKTSFQIAPMEGPTLKLDTVTTFDSELKDTSPSDLIAASFSGGEVDDIALLDTAKSRVIEFFQPTDGGSQWESSMHFRVFETDPHFRGKTGLENEPHDYAALDLDNDGHLDLCLLAHDRVLLYVRKK